MIIKLMVNVCEQIKKLIGCGKFFNLKLRICDAHHLLTFNLMLKRGALAYIIIIKEKINRALSFWIYSYFIFDIPLSPHGTATRQEADSFSS